MKTAKEMLVIAEAAQKEKEELVFGESKLMDLIASASANGDYCTYATIWDKTLIEKLIEHGYSVSEPLYENLNTGMYEQCISWDES